MFQGGKSMDNTLIHREMAHLKSGIGIFLRDMRTVAPAILCLHGRRGRSDPKMVLKI
jgi:hypothetical protein